MPDVFTIAKRSEVMAAIRSRGNKETEMEAIRILRIHRINGWRRGIKINIRHPNQKRIVTIRPDFVFRTLKIAVFIDGEFWHGHPTKARIPKTRTEWWTKKIEGNRARDRLQNRLLRDRGWIVVRIWQFELKTPIIFRKLGKAGLSIK
ncbi:MAG: hypothetical protein BGO12_10800 [Verrucomicrobia bacterium 61-8]|nr:MAG: hypothetical protein BGO12_10800 [Verrucomicrobia bacterium 61-8]